MIKQFRKVVITFLAVSLLACGGGGGGGGGAGAAPPPSTGGTGSGTGGTGGGGSGGIPAEVYIGGLLTGGLGFTLDVGTIGGIASTVTEGGSGSPMLGTIDAFSSIVVDGRTIDTSSAIFWVEGQRASQGDLRQGQSIAVLTDQTGTAANGVFYRANVKGPATSVNVIDATLARAELTVLGQTVRTNATTTFNNVDVGNITAGDLYEISGFVDQAGVIEASYVERKSSLAEYKVMGTLTNLTATTFTLTGLTVDFQTATLENFDVAIADGDVVEVRGTPSAFTTPNQLDASEVERLPTLRVGDTTPVEVDGIVDRFGSSTDFDVQTVPITTDGSTTYQNGDANSVALGVKLVVRGSIQSDGTLLATSVTVQPTNALRAEGHVEAIDPVAGTLTVLGVTFSTRDLLRLEDKSSVGLSPLTLNDLSTGDEVEIRGFLDGTEVVATRVERDDPIDRARLRGPVGAEDPSARTVTVLGVTLSGQAGVTQYQDVNDNVITAEQFHTQVGLGTFVQGEWDVFSNTSQPVDELSIED